ncbi:hypothetical protein PHISCL_03003 [Aspergillus sclerotialis]|uniref:F-box domain protein n=1 Tax=Aspergillus sclerotialis TaxID=2070753 RepID=A0A3A2ZTA8_9EURO|nr:hypothetical protein PHISCL_03003 [Aspergillus sclerotialis]
MSLPNLNRLILKYFTRERGGTMPIFGLTPGSMLPSLRTLALTNFRFGPKEAAGWAQYLRNQHLRRLSLDGNIEMLDFIDCLSGYVPALESLTIRISNGTDPDTKSRTTRLLDAFLSHIDGLTAFTAYDLPKEVLYSAARYQRSHLRQLRFRETGYPELRWSGDQGKDCPFSPEELKTLSSELPRIEQLGIDLRFKGKTHYDILNALASFPNLKHLELNTPYRTDWSFWGHQSIAIAEQWLNESITEDAFNYVASQKKHHEKTSGDSTSTTPCPKLKALDIKGGEWEPFMKDYKAKLLKGLCVYACRRGDAVPGKLYTVRLPCKSQGSVSMVEDSMYEEALHSAGLLDPRKADFGPPIW